MVRHWKKTGGGVVEWEAPPTDMTPRWERVKQVLGFEEDCVGLGCPSRVRAEMRKQYGSLFNNRGRYIQEWGRNNAQLKAKDSPDVDERRRADEELQGYDAIEGAWNTELARLKAQLRILRG